MVALGIMNFMRNPPFRIMFSNFSNNPFYPPKLFYVELGVEFCSRILKLPTNEEIDTLKVIPDYREKIMNIPIWVGKKSEQ